MKEGSRKRAAVGMVRKACLRMGSEGEEARGLKQKSCGGRGPGNTHWLETRAWRTQHEGLQCPEGRASRVGAECESSLGWGSTPVGVNVTLEASLT